MGPIACAERHDSPGLIGELVPGVVAVVDDAVEGFEDPVREPVFAHELPYVFLRVQLRAFCRQGDQRDVGRDDQPAREMPVRLNRLGLYLRRDLSQGRQGRRPRHATSFRGYFSVLFCGRPPFSL
jgi:hypothetical protein